jgi:1-phosphatidylinositol-3-phosphate 5-kinase
LQILLGFSNTDDLQTLENTIDVLELNRLRQELVHDAHIWDRRLYMMHSLTKENCCTVPTDAQCSEKLTGSFTEEPKDVVSSKHGDIESSPEQGQSSTLEVAMNSGKLSPTEEQENMSVSQLMLKTDTIGDAKSEGVLADELNSEKSLPKSQSSASNLSERIDLAWTGSGQFAYDPSHCGMEALPATPASLKYDPAYRKVIAPIRVKSFDASVASRNKLLPVDNPNASIRRSYSQRPPKSIQRISRAQSPTFMNKLSLSDIVNWEGRLLPPQSTSVVIPIYDDELSSIITHAMTVPEYHNFLLPRQDQHTASSILNFAAYESTSNTGSDGLLQSYGSDQPITGNGSKDIHLTVSFEDEDSYSVDKAKFSVTCYFAKQFDAIRRKCCPDELDYIRSLSRCKRWSAQGGKSNAYFAKTLDDRFVIKQVTRTELDSFEDYAAAYFKCLTESVSSGSPTCLTKILGLYQVCIATFFLYL